MTERDWVPCHRRLLKGAKKSLPRAVRFVLLELCHEARVTGGTLEFPPEWDTLTAVHDRIGGDRKEIRKALVVFQIPDATGTQVIRIERDATQHRLEIVKWESWIGPKSGAVRNETYRERKLANLPASQTLRVVTPTVEEKKEEERRVEEPAPEPDDREEPPSGIHQSAPPIALESGFDMARRVWCELWRAKYRRDYEFTDTRQGPNSEDFVLKRMGERALIRGAEAESWLRFKYGKYFADKGDKGWLDTKCHPLRTLERDLTSYGDPKPIARMVPRRTEDAPAPVSLEAMQAYAKLAEGIGKGAEPDEGRKASGT